MGQSNYTPSESKRIRVCLANKTNTGFLLGGIFKDTGETM